MNADEITQWGDRREQALARVVDLLIRRLKVRRRPEEIDPDTPLFGTGLSLDSIDAVELSVCFEAELGIKLAEGEVWVAALRTVNTLVDVVLEHEAEAAAS